MRLKRKIKVTTTDITTSPIQARYLKKIDTGDLILAVARKDVKVPRTDFVENTLSKIREKVNRWEVRYIIGATIMTILNTLGWNLPQLNKVFVKWDSPTDEEKASFHDVDDNGVFAVINPYQEMIDYTEAQATILGMIIYEIGSSNDAKEVENWNLILRLSAEYIAHHDMKRIMDDIQSTTEYLTQKSVNKVSEFEGIVCTDNLAKLKTTFTKH